MKSNSLSDTFVNNTNKVLDVIIFLAEDERVPRSLKEKLLSFLLEQIVRDIEHYADYNMDYYDDKISATAKKLITDLQKEGDYLETINKILNREYVPNKKKQFYTIEKIDLLRKIGKQEEAEKVIDENIVYPLFRKMKVDMLIERKDYKAAKTCLKEGITELKQRFGTENIVREWEELLLQIAKEEGDFDTMQEYYSGLKRSEERRVGKRV